MTNIASIPMLTRPPVLTPLTAIKCLMGPNAFSSLRILIGVTTVFPTVSFNVESQRTGTWVRLCEDSRTFLPVV